MYVIRYYDVREKVVKREYCFRRRALKRLSELIGNEQYELTLFCKLLLTYKEIIPTFIRCFEKQTIIYN
jgi:hypothetical protein